MIRSELEYFFGAIRFFTRLPVPHLSLIHI